MHVCMHVRVCVCVCVCLFVVCVCVCVYTYIYYIYMYIYVHILYILDTWATDECDCGEGACEMSEKRHSLGIRALRY